MEMKVLSILQNADAVQKGPKLILPASALQPPPAR